MKYYIPFAFEMYGKIEVTAATFAEAKKKAREWLEKATEEDMMALAQYLPDSEEIDEEGIARDEHGNILDMCDE